MNTPVYCCCCIVDRSSVAPDDVQSTIKVLDREVLDCAATDNLATVYQKILFGMNEIVICQKGRKLQ